MTFEAGRNAIRLDQSWLSHPISVQPRYLFGVLSEHADGLPRRLETSQSTRARIESLLMPVLHRGDANMDVIAAKMGIGRQMQFRELRVEGTTFEKVLDELRHQFALRRLRAGKASVNETAYLVGFSQPAAFSRAFKRWTGRNPHAMRHESP